MVAGVIGAAGSMAQGAQHSAPATHDVRQADVAAKHLPAITGQLSKRNYKLIAVAATGRATSVRVRAKKFSLRPSAQRVTLHLRAPNGRYAGPVVIERDGNRAVLGVRAGADIGKVTIRKGHATISHLALKWQDPKRTARATKGVPIGAGNMGLVRSKVIRSAPAGDPDRDGIPNPLDVDDNGNLILDGYDHRPRLRNATADRQAASFLDGTNLQLTTLFSWTPIGTVNANGGTTDEELAQAQRIGSMLAIAWDGLDAGSGELDCTGLSYCASGGTGVWRETDTPPDPTDPRAGRPAYPDCCDADNDGMGSLNSAGGVWDNMMFLLTGASTDEIRGEDVLIARGAENGQPVQYPASVGFVFASVPAIASYDDGQGHSRTMTYPRPEQCRPQSIYGQNRPNNYLCEPPVRANGAGDVVLDLTVWRPQRPRLPQEAGTGKWMDVGHLAYGIRLPVGAGGGGYCPASTFEALDPALTVLGSAVNPVPAGAVLMDGAGDQVSSVGNTMRMKLNVSECYRQIGAPGNNPDIQIQVWAYALSSTYPASGPPAWAKSDMNFTFEP